jgi:hypothetical protein
MTDKSLKDRAISIKGKSYVLVSDRIIYFNEKYPEGSIETQLISEPGDDMVLVQAIVLPDSHNPTRVFTAYSQAKWGDGMVNKTAALENCETSAVGRALEMMGIGVIDSVASVDEINKAQTQPEYVPHTPNKTGDKNLNVATQAQRKRIMDLTHALDIPLSADDKVEFTKLCMDTIGKPNPTTVGETEIVITVLETMLQDKVAGL